MGWISLSLRKQTLKQGISIDDLRTLQISREHRGISRELSHQKSILSINKARELRDVKSVFDAIKAERPNRADYDFEDSDDKEQYSQDYADWQQEYENAKMEYEAQNVDINSYYDNEMSEIETEAQDRQTDLEDEKTVIEADRAALQAELDAISEQISTEIKNSAIKFS